MLLPLLTPAIASFGIFQFLWVWNDLLVSLTFTGGTPDVAPLTVRVAELAGTRGGDWHLLPAGAFISMVVPVLVFLFLQRYFVRGLLAGAREGLTVPAAGSAQRCLQVLPRCAPAAGGVRVLAGFGLGQDRPGW